MLAAGGKGAFSVLGVAEVPMSASPSVSLVLTSVIARRAFPGPPGGDRVRVCGVLNLFSLKF